MGWSEEQALKSDVNAIEIAYLGRLQMLRSIFGGGEDEPETKKPDRQAISTGAQFDAMFGVA
ncbi:hypothetical protein [Mesorhizobium sp. M0859]|uniref:hypothetical protein n=1 Tax=Mesorhizobium sp. M0859 TaxID=2957014 RepID=UPI003338EFDD